MILTYLDAGQIVSTHGVRGEMKVLPWTDGPEFLCDFKRVRIDGAEYRVESCRIQKTCNLLKLQGIETVEQAQSLKDKTLQIYRCDAPDDLVFAAELIDMDVYAEEKFLGKITDVLDYPGNKVFVVKGEHEYMIPAVKAFILSTDVAQNVMQVRIIEGMGSHEN